MPARIQAEAATKMPLASHATWTVGESARSAMLSAQTRAAPAMSRMARPGSARTRRGTMKKPTTSESAAAGSMMS